MHQTSLDHYSKNDRLTKLEFFTLTLEHVIYTSWVGQLYLSWDFQVESSPIGTFWGPDDRCSHLNEIQVVDVLKIIMHDCLFSYLI